MSKVQSLLEIEEIIGPDEFTRIYGTYYDV